MSNNDDKKIQQDDSEKVMKPVKAAATGIGLTGVGITLVFIFLMWLTWSALPGSGTGGVPLILLLIILFIGSMVGVIITITSIFSYLFLKIFSKIGLIENKPIRIALICIISVLIVILGCLFFNNKILGNVDSLNGVISNNNIITVYKDKIYYYKRDSKEGTSIFVMDLDGNNKNKLVNLDGSYAIGNAIAYKDEIILNISNSENPTIVIDLDTGDINNLDKKYIFNNFIYDGNKIISGGSIVMIQSIIILFLI